MGDLGSTGQILVVPSGHLPRPVSLGPGPRGSAPDGQRRWAALAHTRRGSGQRPRESDQCSIRNAPLVAIPDRRGGEPFPVYIMRRHPPLHHTSALHEVGGG